MARLLATVFALGLLTGGAYASCIGSSSFQTCNDYSTGNTYTIQRYGNQTYMQGNNYRTGSSWSQNSTTIGNSTFHNGVDKRGRSWSSTCIGGYCN